MSTVSQIDGVVGGLQEARRVLGADTRPHWHEATDIVDGGPIRLAVRDSDQVLDAHQMMVNGWVYDADTADWYIELEEGC